MAKHTLAINGGSSSIKFAIFEAGGEPRRLLKGQIQRIGLADARMVVEAAEPGDSGSHAIAAADQSAAVQALLDWLARRGTGEDLSAVGHRIVHGGSAYAEPQLITPRMLRTLGEMSPFDPDHLAAEIALIEAVRGRFPHLPQVACFDTAFHHDLPTVARLLPIPRQYQADGVRRYGFHGLSYAFSMRELARVKGADAAQGRIIMAHLGNGASLAAVRGGKALDTTMGFTPAAGVPMSTRSGDLDPGLVWYLAQTEGMDAEEFNAMVNHRSGLLGLSETSSDMQDLLRIEAQDARAADAVAIFCYQIKKTIGAFAAALGGLDTLIFSGGIGENAPEVRRRICADLSFLGIELAADRNAAGAEVISTADAPVDVRIVRTDEEQMIALMVEQVLSHADIHP